MYLHPYKSNKLGTLPQIFRRPKGEGDWELYQNYLLGFKFSNAFKEFEQNGNNVEIKTGEIINIYYVNDSSYSKNITGLIPYSQSARTETCVFPKT